MHIVNQALRALKARRDIRVYGVGAAKTGTHSIAALFEGSSLTVGHEPNADELLRVILNERHSPNYKALLQSIFAKEDASINVSQINGYVIEQLYSFYPKAAYILTVRDAEGWIQSLINHMITRECDPDGLWGRFRRLRFDRGNPFRPEDEWLRRQGLFSLDAMLEYWMSHTVSVLRTVPEERLLVVPTTQIAKYKEIIYNFVGVRHASKKSAEHSFRGVYSNSTERFPAGYIRARCAFYSDCFFRLARPFASPDVLATLKVAMYPEDTRSAAAQSSSQEWHVTTDFDRWARVSSETEERWDGRARQAATLLADQDSVLDLGCGAMTLEHYLPAGVKYLPLDCVQRDKRTIVCDLNIEPLPDVSAECVVALGLLEYMDNIEAIFKSISESFRVFVFSYIPVEGLESAELRRSAGWRNNLSINDVERLLSSCQFSKYRRYRYLDRAWIWRAERATE